MGILRLRIHVAPLGFEVDRIVLPAIEMKADVVWLLVHSNRSEDAARPFEERIRSELGGAGIEVRAEYADRKKLFDILRAVRGIIKKAGGRNDIYVNVSSGSKIQAIACMMACMMWNDEENLTPYYAEPKEYASSRKADEPVELSSGLGEIIELPRYRIQIPKKELVETLTIIGRSKGGRITKSDLAKEAEEAGIITVNSRGENIDSVRLTSLANNIVGPLTKEWKFLKTEKVGRTRWISLTDEGKNAAEFLQ